MYKRQRFAETSRQQGSPIVSEMTGDASIDHVDLRNPDLLDAALKSVGLLDPRISLQGSAKTVSYTHLDVYKRQAPGPVP